MNGAKGKINQLNSLHLYEKSFIKHSNFDFVYVPRKKSYEKITTA